MTGDASGRKCLHTTVLRATGRARKHITLLIVAVSQIEVLWPLSVSAGAPEAVVVMRPANSNSRIPFLTVLALPTLMFN